ncbi:MAG TPA: rhodanese-like domain-containing protein [Thermoanaerobaculia bacterium]|nr:rhodanese-like domain-containing protein [Thermoanaerobaculia bacterium]
MMKLSTAARLLQTSSTTLTARVDFDEILRRVEDEDTSCVLLNVLHRAAFESGRIPGSLNLPLAEMAGYAKEVLPALHQEVIVYCASSSCSLAEQALVLLRGLGYSRVREYPGGMEEWGERGGRIERDALPGRAPDPGPPGRMDRLWKVLASCSPAAVFAWASNQSLRTLFGIWLGTSAVFGLLYWGAAHATVSLVSGGAPVPANLGGLGTALAFSLATALSSGYGDVAGTGWMRLAVLVETAAGLVLFSALISKILGAQQERVLNEVHQLTFENRLGRVRTNLHLVHSELAEISGDCSDPSVPPRRLRARIEGVAMIFAGEMQAVRDLVQNRLGSADSTALEALFASLFAGLQELSDLLTCLPKGQSRSGPLRRSLRRIAQLGSEFCGACSLQIPPIIRTWMDRVRHLCHGLCDEPRLGDLAPLFSLPGSDGRVHRLEDFVGQKPVVLAWFPKAFTGG